MARKSFAVIDATVTGTEPRFRGLAAKYVEWQIGQYGGDIVSPKEADVICVTVVSPHEWECVPRALKRNGVLPHRKDRIRQKVVLGGQGGLSPKIFDPFVDVACVGEGRNFIRALCDGAEVDALPNAWVPGEDRAVVPDEDFPWDAPPTMAEDGIVRIYASRSCKKKCLFCNTGWSLSYVENDSEKLIRQYNSLVKAGYRVNVVTNDAPALSFFDDLQTLEHFSASYSQVRELLENGVDKINGKVRSVRLGVEAPSDRLRKLVGKPVPTEGLFDVSKELLNSGIGVRWFMIAGLPGETSEDWEQLREVVIRARHEIKKGAIQLSFTAFCPDSAAPLCLAPLDDSYWDRFMDFWRWFFEGEGFTRKIQLFRCAAPPSRLRHAIGSMGACEADLRTGWLDRDPPNWRIRYPLHASARQAYDVYARRTGLPASSTTAAAIT